MAGGTPIVLNYGGPACRRDFYGGLAKATRRLIIARLVGQNCPSRTTIGKYRDKSRDPASHGVRLSLILNIGGLRIIPARPGRITGPITLDVDLQSPFPALPESDFRDAFPRLFLLSCKAPFGLEGFYNKRGSFSKYNFIFVEWLNYFKRVKRVPIDSRTLRSRGVTSRSSSTPSFPRSSRIYFTAVSATLIPESFQTFKVRPSSWECFEFPPF